MNLKNHLFSILLMITSFTYAQTEKIQKPKSDSAVTEFKIETNSLKKLEKFNWESVYEIFKDNDPNTEINLQVGFNNKTKLKNATIESWNFSISGKTSELESMIKKSKKMISKVRVAKK